MKNYNNLADRHLENVKKICDNIDKTSKTPVPRKVVRDWYIKNVVV